MRHNGNITKQNRKNKIATVRQFVIQGRRINKDIPFSYESYLLYTIQALWDLKRCEKQEYMRYPLAMMIWYLFNIMEQLDRFKVPSQSSSTLNLWLNINNIESVLYQALDDFHIVQTPMLTGKKWVQDIGHTTNNLFIELLIYWKEIVNISGQNLEHVLYLALQFGKEYGQPNNTYRDNELRAIRKKVVQEAKESPSYAGILDTIQGTDKK